MVDNLLLYHGPSRTDNYTNIVTMNETENKLRFDIIIRNEDDGTGISRYIVLEALDGHMKFEYNDGMHSYKTVPQNILSTLSSLIQDTSAHKVYRKPVFKFLRRYTKVDSFRTLVEPEKSLCEAMYPVTKQIPLHSYETLDHLRFRRASVRREEAQAFKQETVQAMAKKLYGQKRYRKDLVKAIAGANSVEFLVFMLSLKREIPVDWFISILRNNPTLSSLPEEYDRTNLEVFYNSMSDKQFRKFCRCLMEEKFVPLQSILDTAAQFAECLTDPHNEIDPVTGIKFRSLEEFHYMVGKYHENTAKERERREMIKKHGGELQGNEWYDQLKKIDFEGAPYEIVIPKYAYEIVEWGKEMSNCIGGYASRAKESKTDVYVALKDKKSGTMKANILISNRNIRQFYSKRNGKVDPEIAFDFNMRLVLGGMVQQSGHLFGDHFGQIINATGNQDLNSVIQEFQELGVGVDDYITLRNVHGQQ